MKGWRLLIPIVCLVAFATADHLARSARGRDRKRTAAAYAGESGTGFLAEPFPLAPFSASDIDGRDVSPSTWRGRVVVVNFWATWCPPCRREIPALAALQQRHAGRVLVLGVLQDNASLGFVRAFGTSSGINYPIVQSTSEIESSFTEALVLPTTYLVDGQGRVVAAHAGEIDPDLLEREVQALLGARLARFGG